MLANKPMLLSEATAMQWRNTLADLLHGSATRPEIERLLRDPATTETQFHIAANEAFESFLSADLADSAARAAADTDASFAAYAARKLAARANPPQPKKPTKL